MKNKAKRIIIPILASRPVSAVASRIFGTGIPIFMLHRMDTPDNNIAGGTRPDHLRRCLQYLVDNNYCFISLQQLVMALRTGQKLPPRAVVFTMDDGFTDQAKTAAPIFEEFNCPLTFFVITGMLDQALWPWDAQVAWITETSGRTSLNTGVAGKSFSLPLDSNDNRRQAKRILQDVIREAPAEQINTIMKRIADDAGVAIPEKPPATYRAMDWDMARQLERKGIQFAPHSVSHNILSRLDDSALQYEISESWRTLDRELLNPLKVFCYPTGRENDYDQREIDTLREHGFLGAVTTTPDLVESQTNNDKRLFRLPRYSVPDSMEDFIQYCTWIEYVKCNHRP